MDDQRFPDLRAFIEGIVEWTWRALEPAPPDLLRTFSAMSIQDPVLSELCDQYDRYERKAFARMLAKLTPRDRIPSPLAAARLIDLVVPTVAMWALLHPDDSRGVKEAAVDMIYRYLTA